MKTSVLLPVSVLLVSGLGGCSVLDAALNSTPHLDPTKVYLGREMITVDKEEIQRYACIESILVCNGYGHSFDCSCMR